MAWPLNLDPTLAGAPDGEGALGETELHQRAHREVRGAQVASGRGRSRHVSTGIERAWLPF